MDRLPTNILDAAEKRAKDLAALLGPATRKLESLTLMPAVITDLRAAVFDVERLAEEVRRLQWIHLSARELIEAAKEYAFHEQARLLRESGTTFVPNRGAKEAGERWTRMSVLIEDGLTASRTRLGVVLDVEAKEKRLEAKVLGLERLLKDASARVTRAEEQAQAVSMKLAEFKAANQEIRNDRDEVDEEVTRLKQKVNMLVAKLREEREAAGVDLAVRFAKMVAREVARVQR